MKQQFLKHLLLFTVFSIGFISDIVTKEWASKELQPRGQVIVFKNYLDFSYTENRGMVFGLFNGDGQEIVFPVLLVLNILASIAIFIYIWIKRYHSWMHLLPFYIIQSGAIGNIIDKLRYGYVVDFIHIHLRNWLDWPYLFNAADALLCIGIGMLLIQSIVRQDR